jgi:uncharacterized membrane protein YczE
MPIAASPDAPLARRAGTLGLGLVCVAVGVAFTIRAELGVAPYDVLTTGIAESTGIPIGIAAMILPAIFVAIGVLIGGRVGLGTLVSVLVVGPMLGVVLDALPEQTAMLPRLAYFAVGFALINTGITLVIVSSAGSGPAEVLTLAIHDRGIPIAPARTGIELVCVLLGWILGGQVGAGTVVFAFGVGPCLRWGLERCGYDHAVATAASTTASPGA